MQWLGDRLSKLIAAGSICILYSGYRRNPNVRASITNNIINRCVRLKKIKMNICPLHCD